MTYTIPPLTRSQVADKPHGDRPSDCEQCQTGTPVDHWPSPVACRSSYRRDDDGIERVSRVHCTCDYCF